MIETTIRGRSIGRALVDAPQTEMDDVVRWLTLGALTLAEDAAYLRSHGQAGAAAARAGDARRAAQLAQLLAR